VRQCVSACRCWGCDMSVGGWGGVGWGGWVSMQAGSSTSGLLVAMIILTCGGFNTHNSVVNTWVLQVV
jgi:hypothetical protein